jgi:predicted site-specific integrase-resolvase
MPENATTTSPSPDTGALLTFSQTAQRLGVDVQTVRRWVCHEQAPIVLDSRGRKRIPASWAADPQGWLNHGAPQ